MAKNVIVNKTGSLNWRDLLKGGIVAAISPAFTILIQSLQAGDFQVNWKSILNVAIIAFLTYLSKNLFGPASVTTTYSTNDKAASVAEDVNKSNAQN